MIKKLLILLALVPSVASANWLVWKNDIYNQSIYNDYLIEQEQKAWERMQKEDAQRKKAERERQQLYENIMLKCVSFMKYEIPADKAISGCDCATKGLLNATKGNPDNLLALMMTPRMMVNVLRQETYYCLTTGNKPYEQ